MLFDFDGVLVDSFAATFRTYKEFYPKISEEEFGDFFLGNIYDTMRKYEQKNSVSLDVEKFRKKYSSRLLHQLPVLKMKDLIRKITPRFLLIIISSTTSRAIKKYLEKHGMDHYFAKIYGGDVHKSKTAKIQMVFKTYRAKPDKCVFITDTLGDIREAKKCQVKAIAVAWGFHDKKVLLRGDPHAVVERPEDLPDAIHSFFNK